MSAAPRTIVHPGPVARERTASAAGRGRWHEVTLEAGLSINDAVRAAFAACGAPGGYIRLHKAVIDPMRYVIPAPAPGDGHAAWYSETFAPEGPCRIEDAGMIVGWRDGEPFLHCHGIWTLPDGVRRMGHLLPLDSALSAPATVKLLAVKNAAFDVRDDAETQFRLFAPRVDGAAGDGTTGERILVCAVRPNEDICTAVETMCRDNEIENARVHGIGSLIGALFEDGQTVASYATEVLVTQGSAATVEGAPVCTLDIAIVGIDGVISGGRLVRGHNPVCVTFELFIEVL